MSYIYNSEFILRIACLIYNSYFLLKITVQYNEFVLLIIRIIRTIGHCAHVNTQWVVLCNFVLNKFSFLKFDENNLYINKTLSHQGPLLLTWISNFICYKVWYEIT